MKPINRHTSSDPIECLPVNIWKIEPMCLRQPDWKTLISTYTKKKTSEPQHGERHPSKPDFETFLTPYNVANPIMNHINVNHPQFHQKSVVKNRKNPTPICFPLGCRNYRGRIVCGADWRCSHADANSAWAGLGLPWVIGDRKQNEATEW